MLVLKISNIQIKIIIKLGSAKSVNTVSEVKF